MRKKDYRKMIRAYLKSYKVIKAKIEIDKKILKLTHGNMTTKDIEERSRLEYIIKENELKIQAIETVVAALNDTQKTIIQERFIKSTSNIHIADKIYMSERTVRNYLNEVYDLIGIAR